MQPTFRIKKWLCGACLMAAASGCAHGGGSATSMWSRLTPSGFAQKEDDTSTKLHVAYGRWQEQQGSFVAARTAYKQALDGDPKSVDAILGLARLDQLAGRTAEAEQGYQKALKLQPNDPAIHDAAGQFYAAQGRWSEAVEHANAAMLEAPGDVKYRYNLAVVLAKSGDINAAMPHFARTVGDAEAHYNVGYILYEQGDHAAAEQQFLQAVLKQPNLAEAQAMLDELRQTRDEQLILAGNADRTPRLGHTLPQRPGWTPHQPALPVTGAAVEGIQTTGQVSTQPAPPAVQTAVGSRNPFFSSQTSVIPPETTARVPVAPPAAQPAAYPPAFGSANAPAASVAGPYQPPMVPQQPTMQTPAPQIQPAPPAGISPQQLEQWQNQQIQSIGFSQ